MVTGRLVCKNCGVVFDTNEEAGKHAQSEQHYTFKVEGTTAMICFACF